MPSGASPFDTADKTSWVSAAGASFSVANAYASDVSTTEERAKSFGLIGAAFGLGFIFGPVIGGLLGSVNLHLPFYAAAAKLAGVAPERIFFADDRLENVAAALAAGWDAVLFESVSQLNAALRDRGVVINY